ncbi:MAG: HAD family hydrolase [Candidatus Yanofskybacteria bacterium]|nr:HAD family hydrolase [Candidatus Yanofskybacteria bacterium]
MIKAMIFDLDMCILDTHTLAGSFFQPVLDALYSSELPQDVKEKIQYQLWTTSLDDTMEMFSVSEDIAERMREAYRGIEVPDGIKTFGDEEFIRGLPVSKILVTTGYIKFQQTKIEKIGVADLFDEIIIDSLDYKEKRRGKKRIFEELLVKNGWNKDEVLVVGDNPRSELGAAKSLGIRTVQTLRPTIEKWEGADYHICSFNELAGIVSGLAA